SALAPGGTSSSASAPPTASTGSSHSTRAPGADGPGPPPRGPWRPRRARKDRPAHAAHRRLPPTVRARLRGGPLLQLSRRGARDLRDGSGAGRARPGRPRRGLAPVGVWLRDARPPRPRAPAVLDPARLPGHRDDPRGARQAALRHSVRDDLRLLVRAARPLAHDTRPPAGRRDARPPRGGRRDRYDARARRPRRRARRRGEGAPDPERRGYRAL